jgi:hypothetical protein
MPAVARVYKVFISSPADLNPQRDIARKTIETVSTTYANRGVRVEHWTWDRDASSEFGQPAQEKIKRQLGPYDIYIGIMGRRFGSPTASFGSGTEEEFNAAIDALGHKKLIRLGFLFKDENISTKELNKSDYEQLIKVTEFKDKIGSRGLFSTFTTDIELTKCVNTILCSAIDDDLANLPSEGPLWPTSSSTSKLVLSQDFINTVLNRLEEDLTNGMNRPGFAGGSNS